MDWLPDKSRPIGPQICEHLCVGIACGIYQPGQKLPSVRELAINLGVNPNTVQHALEGMVVNGLLYAIRGSGWYVGEDLSRAQEVLTQLRQQKITAFFKSMQALGVSPTECKTLVEEWSYE